MGESSVSTTNNFRIGVHTSAFDEIGCLFPDGVGDSLHRKNLVTSLVSFEIVGPHLGVSGDVQGHDRYISDADVRRPEGYSQCDV